MANPPTHCYVDPSIAANSGTGTSGDPYGDLQYALDTEAIDATDGNQFNIKSGTDEVLTAALSLTTYGSPNQNAPLIFRGYTTTADDGGQGGIDCGGFSLITNSGNSISFVDLEIHNGPSSGTFFSLTFYGQLINCYLHDATSFINAADDAIVYGCRFEDMGTSVDGVISVNEGMVAFCYFDVVTGTRDPIQCIRLTSNGASAMYNIIYVDSDANGIRNHSGGRYERIVGNTILANAGTGTGILIDASGRADNMLCIDNYCEGFSGTGGIGFLHGQSSENGGIVSNNAAYNNATDYSLANDHAVILSPNETLSATGLAKSGSITYANRLAYFAPADEGAMRTGASQPGNIS